MHPEHSIASASEPRTPGDSEATAASPSIVIGGRILPSRYFLSPLAGYTHHAFRLALRRLGGLGLATTDLVHATMLVSEHRKSLDLVATCPEDRPLSVQIFGSDTAQLISAARWLQDHDYESVDINMGCPMAKINGSGGGARLMCNISLATESVARVIDAVRIPVTVKMRLGWDSNNLTAPQLAAELEKVGVAAITVHGRTRAQGFHGSVNREGIRQTVQAVSRMPVIGNGDVRTVDEAISMIKDTGCSAVAIGRGAMLDPWIFRRLQLAEQGSSGIQSGKDFQPTSEEQIDFLITHFRLMTLQHGEFSCRMFRKFAAWYGARLGIPEDLEARLRTFESSDEFNLIIDQIRHRHGERISGVATALVRVPNGPISHW